MDYQRNVLLGSGGDRRNYLQISVGSKFEAVVLIYRREQKSASSIANRSSRHRRGPAPNGKYASLGERALELRRPAFGVERQQVGVPATAYAMRSDQ